MSDSKSYFIWIWGIFVSGILFGIYFTSDTLDVYPYLKFSGIIGAALIVFLYLKYGKRIYSFKKRSK